MKHRYVLVPEGRLDVMFSAARRMSMDDRDPEHLVIRFLSEWFSDLSEMKTIEK